jgi:hypothetical protein
MIERLKAGGSSIATAGGRACGVVEVARARGRAQVLAGAAVAVDQIAVAWLGCSGGISEAHETGVGEALRGDLRGG